MNNLLGNKFGVMKQIIGYLSLLICCFTAGKINLAFSNPLDQILQDMKKERFALSRIEAKGFQNNIRVCVFESPSFIWTIDYCEAGVDIEGRWHGVMAGKIEKKHKGSEQSSSLLMKYYIENSLHNFKQYYGHLYEAHPDNDNVYSNIIAGFMRSIADTICRIEFPKAGKSYFNQSAVQWAVEHATFLRELSVFQLHLIYQSKK